MNNGFQFRQRSLQSGIKSAVQETESRSGNETLSRITASSSGNGVQFRYCYMESSLGIGVQSRMMELVQKEI